ncbi:MAG: hypothetical protein ACYCZV_12335 [Acidimicrobiales bacterium]
MRRLGRGDGSRPVGRPRWCLGLGAVVGALLLGACGQGSSARAGLDPAASVSIGCVAPTHPTYAGARPGDCLAGATHHFVVAVDGYEVLVGNWKRTTDDAGHHLICAGVNIENVGALPIEVRASELRLQAPSGKIETARADTSNGLAGGRLPTGAQEGGSVCWADPGQGGQYVARFVPPDPAAHDGVWLISFLPASG